MSWEEPTTSGQQPQRPFSRHSWRRPAIWLALLLVVGLLVGPFAGSQPVRAAALAQAGPNGGTLTIVGANGAQLYSTPGGDVVNTLTAGTVLTAVGRSADSLWVVVYNDNGVSGWVEVAEVVLFGLEQLPVMVEGVAPAAQPTGAATPNAAC